MVEKQILDNLRSDDSVTLFGGSPGHLALILARLVDRDAFAEPLVVVTPDEDSARQLCGNLTFFLGQVTSDSPMKLDQVMFFPEIETSPYAEISPDRAAVMARMAILFCLTQGLSGKVLVASAASIRRKLVPRRTFVNLCDLIAENEELDRDDTVCRLIAAGYSRTKVVEDPGTFSVRGGILDIFPPLHRFPVRIELFGDLVESIRLFDPTSQRTLRSISEAMLHPVRETVRSAGIDTRAKVLEAADRASCPSRATRALLEEIEGGREFFGIEALTPAFHDGLETLGSYLPNDHLWVVVDPEQVQSKLETEDERSEEAFLGRVAENRIAFPPDEFFSSAKKLLRELENPKQVRVCVLGQDLEGAAHKGILLEQQSNSDIVAELRCARSEKGQEILKGLGARLRKWEQEQHCVVIAGGSVGHVQRLDSLLKGHGVHAEVRSESGAPDLLAVDLPSPGVKLRVGDLSAGFRLASGLVLLSEEEIFGPKTRKRPERRIAGLGMGDLRELKEDDCVVHALHGIGRYRGLVKLQVKGVPGDFLLIEYAGGDRLYLPIYRMNQVQKYVAAESAVPKLDRLGGVTWTKKQQKVRKEVRKLGEELLQLYAQRAALSGHSFPPPDALYGEFEASFPFDETPDQIEAAEDVLKDLCTQQPMDRLVCGDVGFGKTEVALRAAFVVAMAGKQVALLAPTTILVEQHCRTFIDRMRMYPLRIEAISRFSKPKQLRQVLAALESGKVDIAIGTHRLLSPDVRFKDLGLLIIDEEQRFGVAHKERIKRLRTQVDVLTLTATPIPRTLQMGMVGLREISIIATPPVDRLAIRTSVCRFDEKLVAEAIQREMDRGGQIFFVHNKVED
ncbi:MAG: DEAD/DEAH box helicase, partial [Pseudomonadota bacterium]